MPIRFRSTKAPFAGAVLALAAGALTAPLYAVEGSGSTSSNHVKVELVNASGADVGFVS
jgi:hypothetical protein